MKTKSLLLALSLGVFAATSASACVAEFKAKRGNQYVHSTISVPNGSCNEGAVQGILSSQGYTNIVVVRVTPS